MLAKAKGEYLKWIAAVRYYFKKVIKIKISNKIQKKNDNSKYV